MSDEMESTRYIKDIDIPAEETNASLRVLLRQSRHGESILRVLLRRSHHRESILRDALEYCKAMATNGTTSSHRDCIYGKCVRALEEAGEI